MKKSLFWSILSVSAAIVLIVILCSGTMLTAQNRKETKDFFWSLFDKGRLQGNLQIKPTDTKFITTSNGFNQLALMTPGKSSLRYVFTLSSMPSHYYMLNEWESNPGDKLASVRINVNGTQLTVFKSASPKYMSQGFEISKLLKAGENTVDIDLLQDGSALWIRGTLFTENPSLARNVELMPDLLPAYAKALALVLLVLGVLYLIWFFFNRTLYKNMDVFSASFALIGIMISSIATGYCCLLIPDKMKMSFVFLGITVFLTLLALLSGRRGDAASRGMASESESSGEEKVTSGGDFNF